MTEQLVGLGALVTAVINLLKRFGVVPDGYAGLAAAIGNILVYVVLVLGKYYEVDLAHWDDIAATVARLLVMIVGSLGVHLVGRKMEWPLFGPRKRSNVTEQQ